MGAPGAGPPPAGAAGRQPAYPLFRPVALPAYPGFPSPPGYAERSRGNTGFMVVGATAFVISYGMGIAYGAANGFEANSGLVLIPVVGPFLAAAHRDFSCPPLTGILDPAQIEQNARECQEKTIREATAVGVLAGVGLGQLLGATLFAAGILDRQKMWVRTDLVTSEAPRSRELTATGGVVTFGGKF